MSQIIVDLTNYRYFFSCEKRKQLVQLAIQIGTVTNQDHFFGQSLKVGMTIQKVEWNVYPRLKMIHLSSLYSYQDFTDDPISKFDC